MARPSTRSRRAALQTRRTARRRRSGTAVARKSSARSHRRPRRQPSATTAKEARGADTAAAAAAADADADGADAEPSNGSVAVSDGAAASKASQAVIDDGGMESPVPIPRLEPFAWRPVLSLDDDDDNVSEPATSKDSKTGEKR